jgi:hypothetical protein
MRIRPCLAAALVGSSVLQAAVPVVEEEGQPVAANVQRVREALAFLGAPLPPYVDGPLAVGVGGGPPAGRTRTVELVVNGQVAGTREVPADRRLHEVRFDVPIRRSAWVALRSFPQLHTNPVFVSVDGKPIRGSKERARWCVGVIERLWDVRGKGIAAAERPEAERAFQEAIAVYSRIAAESD